MGYSQKRGDKPLLGSDRKMYAIFIEPHKRWHDMVFLTVHGAIAVAKSQHIVNFSVYPYPYGFDIAGCEPVYVSKGRKT